VPLRSAPSAKNFASISQTLRSAKARLSGRSARQDLIRMNRMGMDAANQRLPPPGPDEDYLMEVEVEPLYN